VIKRVIRLIEPPPKTLPSKNIT